MSHQILRMADRGSAADAGVRPTTYFAVATDSLASVRPTTYFAVATDSLAGVRPTT